MPEVDSLDVKIAASAENAIKSLDTLIGKLNTVTGALKFDTSGIKNIGASMKSVESTLNGVEKEVEKVTKNMRDEFMNATKDIGKGYRYEGTFEGVQKQLSKYTNALENAKIRVQELEAAGRTSGGEFQRAISNLNKYQNMVDGLKKQLKEMNNFHFQSADEIPINKNTVETLREATEETQRFGEAITGGVYAGRDINAEVEKIAKTAETAQTKVKDMFANIKPLDFSGNAFELEKFVSDLENNIAKIESKMRKLSTLGIGEDTQRFQGLNYDLQQAIGSLEKWEVELAKLRDAGELDISIPGLEESIDNATMKWGIFSRTLRAFRLVEPSEQLQNIRTRLDEIQQKYNQIADSIEQKARSQPFFGTTQQFKNQQVELDALRQEYQDLINTQRQLSLSGYQFDFGRWTEGFENVGGAVLNATGKIGSFIKRLASVAINAKTARKSMDNLKNVSNQLTKSLTRVTNMLKMMIVRMALRKVIEGVGTGFKGLALYSDEFNRSLSMLINSLKQLGYSVSAAVSPLVNAFAPALNQIIQLAIKAVNYINQLLSALTGKSTWIRAKKQTESYADSLKKAGSAAKGSLRAFDELKVISTSSEGGGTDDINPSDMFETIDINDNIMNLSDRLKQMWGKADFTELGNIIGQKIKDGLDRVDWNPIQETAGRIGKSIATLINGFVETEGLGISIGQTLGNAVNTGIIFANNFLDNTHFDSIGTFIGEGINDAIGTIDFEGIGHLLAQSFNGIFDILGNMSVTVDWKNLGANLSSSVNTFFADFKWEENAQSLSDSIKGLLDTIIGFLEETNWWEIGDSISDFIANIDYSGIASRLAEGIGAALGGLAALVGGFITDAFIGIEDYFGKQIEDAGGNVVEGILVGIAEALVGIGDWIKEHVFQPFIDGFKKAFDIHSPAKSMNFVGENIILGIFEGFGFVDFAKKMSDWWNKNVLPWFTLERWSNLGNNIKISLLNKWSEFTNWFNGTGISAWWSNITSKLSLPQWNIFGDNVKNSLTSKWNAFVSWFNGTGVAKWWNNIVSKFSQSQWNIFGNNIKNSLSAKWNSFTSWFDNTGFSNWWRDVQDKFSANKWNFSGISSGLTTAWNTAISGIKQIWNNFANWLNKKLNFEWDSVEVLGKEIVPAGSIQLGRIPTFAQGGFPEDGWFRANKGELIGKWDDGRSAVSTNGQIISGIAEGIYPAVYNAVSVALQNNKDLLSQGDTKIYVGTREITDVVIDNIANRTIKNQKTPFPIMV